ncbi:MAG TPA: DNA-deoxyinosine glycosylase [Woeseiaceae bacterium]|jgi:hypoxanthine-DNA glycosylase|nr:DNA-deoxyinosine glycosylase [Woeseiaceae bacterium]
MAAIPAEGFPPIARADARVLILGSLPGQRSIAEQQYYAHPQNAFWRIMSELFAIEGDYATRCSQLIEHRIALWDVLMSSVRPGSMDADIRLTSATANDFSSFFVVHPGIQLIAFNGRKAEQLFGRFVVPTGIVAGKKLIVLPSTSPAFASLSFSGKLAAWRATLAGD